MSDTKTISNETVTKDYIKDKNSKAGYVFLGFSVLGLVIAILFHYIGLGVVQEFRESEFEVVSELAKQYTNTSTLHETIQNAIDKKDYLQTTEDFFKSKLDILKNAVETNTGKNTYEDYKGIYGILKGGILEQDTSISKIIMRLLYEFKNKNRNIQKTASTFLDENYTKYLYAFIYLIAPVYFIVTKVFLTSSFMSYYYNHMIMSGNNGGFFDMISVVIIQIIGFITGIVPILIAFYNTFTNLKRGLMPSMNLPSLNNTYIILSFLCMILFYTFSTSYVWLILLRLNTYLFSSQSYLNIILPIFLIGMPLTGLGIMFFYTLVSFVSNM